jgi:phosphate transport system permease protein
MPPELSASSTAAALVRPFRIRKQRTRFLGLTLDECIQGFFGGNAFVAVIVLALITVFLFREGSSFFGQNRDNLVIYRQAGLEYVDIIRQQEKDHAALARYLSSIRLDTLRHYLDEEKLAPAEAQKRLAPFDDFATRYSDAVESLRGLVSELGDLASAIKQKNQINHDNEEKRRQLLAVGKGDEATAVQIVEIDFPTELAPLKGTLPVYEETSAALAKALGEIAAVPPSLPTPELQARMNRFEGLNRDYVAGFPATLQRLKAWDYSEPVSLSKSFRAFIFGLEGHHEWLTASFWQDWYCVVPLLTGSLLVSFIALCLAIPLGVGAAIYVNQLASPAEQRAIKPAIEFISAIP